MILCLYRDNNSLHYYCLTLPCVHSSLLTEPHNQGAEGLVRTEKKKKKIIVLASLSHLSPGRIISGHP